MGHLLPLTMVGIVSREWNNVVVWCDQQTRGLDKEWHPGHGADDRVALGASDGVKEWGSQKISNSPGGQDRR